MEEARGDAGLTTAVDLIRAVNDAIGAREPWRITDLLDEDVVWEHNLGGGSPEEGVYSGREDVVRLFERILEPWEYVRPEPEEIEELGGGTCHVRGKLWSKHSTTASEIVTPYEQQLEIHDGVLQKASMTMGSR